MPYSRKGADTCLSCHDDQVTLAIFRTPHGSPDNPHSPFGARQLQCEACHGPGGDHSGRVRRGQERPAILSFLKDDPTDAGTQNQMCLGCHTADAGVAWHSGAHAANEISCASCHTVHAPKDAMAHPATQNESCFSCHAEQRTQSRKPFAHPLHNGKMSCSSCHNPHGTTASADLQQQDVNTTCFSCHAEKRGPFLWEHAPVAEDCLSCHNPHGASQPGMLVRRAPLLCQSCHSQAGHPSVVQTPGGLPTGGAAPSPYLLGNSCMNCHSQVHGSNHPSGSGLSR
ncbi:MAG: DmsE family decaheme c-type cytochrome [Gammaproteobacteria bacterium]|nr:DmsE family decaheme c-type cytochrome [Gammaproteobacteria bacterium]